MFLVRKLACPLMPPTILNAWSLWANASSDRSRHGQLTDSSGVLQLLLLYSEQQQQGWRERDMLQVLILTYVLSSSKGAEKEMCFKS